MSFRFTIKRAVKIAGVTTIEGQLENGVLRHGVVAIAMTREGAFEVLVQTVAFIDPPKAETRERTLTIAEPTFELALLNGATLTSDDEST